MSWLARRAGGASRRARVLAAASVSVAVACGLLLLIPGNVDATAVTDGLGGPAPRPAAAAVSGISRSFGGTAAVGALFTVSGGVPGTHFCTASVVYSTGGDLAVTAAHCLAGRARQMVFVPGYASGREPYGVWPVTAVYTDQAWQSAQDPDDDFAFLRLADSSGGVPVENVTGAEQLGTGSRPPATVRVIGYPDAADRPISCTNRAQAFSSTQLEFDCAGYTDGTSGGPFLTDVSGGSGLGTVIGVIGGYEQGGDTAQVSYAAAFGVRAAALYQEAQAAG
ncbi:MAG TPA: trypsin-like peptidase domain-containing protein [Trebonia sp.]|nr:trypsin-like peptidase domain-containing protein [Trebonia sp.]